MTTDHQPILVINSKWQATIGLLVGLCVIAGTVWGVARAAIGIQVNEAVEQRLKDAGFATVQDLDNFRSLLQARMDVFDNRQHEIADRIEYIYRRELERQNRGQHGQ